MPKFLSYIRKKLRLNYSLYIFFLILFYALTFKPFESNLFNYRFVDEEDNFFTGKWVLQGKKLYDNLYFQHQPIPSLISSGIQSLTQPNTVFLLVKRHREFIFFFSLITWILLIARFGAVALAAGLLIETVKHSFLGHLFLAESLSVPAIAYLILLLLHLYSRQGINALDKWLFPICLIYLQFLLLPLSAFTLTIFAISIYSLRHKLKFVAPLVICSTIFAILIISTSSLHGYFQTTITSNLLDFIPAELSNHSLTSKLIFVLFKPIQALTYHQGSLGAFLIAINATYLFYLTYFATRKKWALVSLAIILPILLNFRPQPISDGYAGFHLLPWFCGLVIVTTYLLATAIKLGSDRIKFLSQVLLLLLILLSAIHVFNEYRHKSSPFDQWYINYSTNFDYGQTLKELSKPTDNLLTIPNGSLIYWQSSIDTASKFFFVYNFMYNHPNLSRQIVTDIGNDLPSFIYYEGNLEADQLLGKYANKYTPIFKDQKKSWLFVEQSRYDGISDLEWEKISRYGFSRYNKDYL